MKTHVKVCMKSDWTTYCLEEHFDKIKDAMLNKEIVEVRNIFNGREILDGSNIAVVLMSTVESRAAYEEFEKMINDETEEFKKENPEWMKDL